MLMYVNGSTVPPLSPLSPRQRQVLSLCARNLSDEQIAQRLGISTHTVNTHLRKAFARLGASSRLQAILLALHHHQLELGELLKPFSAA